MQTLISSVVKKGLQKAYQKAESFIDEERKFSFSQDFVNATIERYVTDNVNIIQDLHTVLHDGWLCLYATLDVKGIQTTLSVDLKLRHMEMNQQTQLMVFEQLSNTRIEEATFKNIFLKWGCHFALWYYQKFRDEDPLGMILERFEVVKVKDQLLHLDLNRWLGDKTSIIDILKKVHVNRARVRPDELIVWGNINLTEILVHFSKDQFEDGFEADATDIQPQNISSNEVTK